ncbi:MAG: hypothetical protein GTN64_08610, partial [Candidatus Latescibacteria bacterium]|nr:hypothetical protein [Candidatus Latescibacterota bacterium]NIO78660.1 hypothetical protein [Candidatus Latescibacterota bacterium]
ILEEYLDQNLEEFGVDRYFRALDIQNARESRWLAEFPHRLGDGWRTNPDIAIKIAAPNRQKMTGWGDYHFARGLARAFSGLGHRVSIDAKDSWYQNSRRGGIDLVIRGRTHFKRQPGRKSFFWNISKGMREINYQQADHVFWASKKAYDEAVENHGEETSTLLPQAFDAELMNCRGQEERDGIVFVGRRRSGSSRKAVHYAHVAGEQFSIWGPGWDGTAYASHLAAYGINNCKVPALYRSAEIVLNDHTPAMKNRGILSNRVFDTLACGAIPVSEDVGWLPNDIA